MTSKRSWREHFSVAPEMPKQVLIENIIVNRLSDQKAVLCSKVGNCGWLVWMGSLGWVDGDKAIWGCSLPM